jgi:hypothetical protein
VGAGGAEGRQEAAEVEAQPAGDQQDRHDLVDLIDLSIHPLLVGHGGLLLRDGLEVPLRLVSAKCFSQIVKLTYQPQARP